MKTLKILFAALIIAGFATSAMAQDVTTTQNVTASAAVIDDISIEKKLDVDFGAVQRNGSVVIDTKKAEPDITANGGLGGEWSFGEIEVTATEGVSFQVNWPGAFNLVNQSGGGAETMEFTPEFSLNNLLYESGEEVIASSGIDTFRIGGTLVVGEEQVAGQYEGIFIVTAEYN
jgi:hypothetical protein